MEKQLDVSALLCYGFKKKGDGFEFVTDILGGKFQMNVFVDKNANLSTKVYDHQTGEEYILHLVAAQSGEFVGSVRAEYDKILEEINKKCFKNDVFNEKQAKMVINFAKDNFGDELEFLWEKLSDVAILRRKDTKK